MKTKVFTNEDFNGRKQFKIYEVDEDGKKIAAFDKRTGKEKEPKPLLNIGITKAKLIKSKLAELETFIKEN
jgi:spermidine/putrescine-binding protein